MRRVWEHREGIAEGFTRKYGVSMLVHNEERADIVEASRREQTMRDRVRRWKLNAVEAFNPEWRDLWCDIAS